MAPWMLLLFWKKTGGPDPPSGSGSLCSDETTGLSFLVISDACAVCARVPLAKSAKDVSVPTEGHPKTAESISDLRPSVPAEFAVASLSVPSRVPLSVTRRAKNPTATGKAPLVQKKLAPERGKIKLMFYLDSSSSAKPASASQCRSPSVGRPKG